MGWQRCVEFLAIALCVGGALLASAVAFAAIVQAWRKTRELRAAGQPNNAQTVVPESEDHKAKLDAFWNLRRKQWAGFASDLNHLSNPLRRDGIEMVKEASQWGRLAVQYALIGAGGGLLALPHLTEKVPHADMTWSGVWFVSSLVSSALCCCVAYADFQVNASMYWANLRIEIRAAQQRHFELNDQVPIASHLEMLGALAATTVKTSLSGVFLALLAWVALGWGALRLVLLMS